jgi:Arc/MetJ-type ribon-helix-helix transcriptional regulator
MFDTSGNPQNRERKIFCRSHWLLFKYQEFPSLSLTVFDNVPNRTTERARAPEARREELDDARIALRCNRKELRLVDSFVTNGEFSTRSELMRAALHAFLRSRAMSTAPTPAVDAEGFVEVPVRLRPEEYAALETYAHHVANGRPVRDILAEIVRRGEMEMKVHELVQRARATVREAVETRTQVGALGESGKDLERKGVVGR